MGKTKTTNFQFSLCRHENKSEPVQVD